MSTMNGVSFTIIPLPSNKYSIKATYAMVPKGLTIHNTYNDATARNEIAYMHRNNNYTSYHLAVDDKEVLQGVPFNRSTYHAGDGKNGYGNRNHIGLEICYSKSGGARYAKAEENAVKVAAQILKNYGWDISKMKKHQDWSGKWCPHRILDEKRWNSFVQRVTTELKRLNGVSKPSNPSTDIHTVVKLGSKGSAVVELQNQLKRHGYNLTADGIFGQGTHNAVLAFQKGHKLVADGIVGKATWDKLIGNSQKPSEPSKPQTNKGELTMSQYNELKKMITDLQNDKAKKLPSTQRADLKKLFKHAFDNGIFTTNHVPNVDNMTHEEALNLLLSYVARTIA